MSETIRAVALHPFKDSSGDHGKLEAGDPLELEDEERAERWMEEGLIAVIGENEQTVSADAWPWGVHSGRDLTCLEEEPGDWDRVVVGLNIWQDLDDLKSTYETWYPHVDHVIAVDGAYRGVSSHDPWSTDGTLDFLRSLNKVELVETDEFWEDQALKRSVYFRRAEEGDLLLVVDADENIYGAEKLRDLPHLDVGWARYENPVYTRVQDFPRVFRIRPGMWYRKRHHWVFDQRGDLITTCQRGGRDQVHRVVPITVENHRGIHRTRKRERQAHHHRVRQAQEENRHGPDFKGALEPLRIAQFMSIDPGMVGFRLHTGINATTPHESIMASSRHDRPYREPYQYGVSEDRETLREAVAGADLVHCHLSYQEYYQLGIKQSAPTIIHHHGTMFRRAPDARNQEDERRADVRLVSNLELLSYGDDLHFLPNPVPFARYRRLGEELTPNWEDRPFRVAHSPTKRHRKGTEEFLAALEALQGEGIEIEPVMVEDDTLQTSIRKKAASHACFDSFFLGLQCSGLEAAATGCPVVGGDGTVRERYEDWLGACPYTFADNEAALTEALRRLATDRSFFMQERERVRSYTRRYHDYAAVSWRYLQILDEELNWREHMLTKNNPPGIQA